MLGVLHNVPDPVRALANVRRKLSPTGALLLMQPAAPPESESLERANAMLYALSALYAVPVSAGQGGRGVGAALSLDQIEGFLEEAGFARAEQLPINHGLNVFVVAYAT